MSKPEPMVAILTTRINPTLTDLRSQIESFELSKLHGIFKDGRPFFIATRPGSLRGKPLLDYKVWSFADAYPREMRDLQEMRIIAEQRLQRTV